MSEADYTKTGEKILSAARSELCMNLPYLDEALFSLRFVPAAGETASAATDGENLFYAGAFLAERYLRSGSTVNRLYLHMLLHCMFRHLPKKRTRDPKIWDLACDVAVESIIDSLDYPCLKIYSAPSRQMFYGQCLREMKVITAEGVYLKLKRDRKTAYETAVLQREFLADDHGLWASESKNGSRDEQDEKWKNISSKAQTGMETVLSREAQGGETFLTQLRITARDDVDYRAFLRRFAAPREIMKSDDDAFDYIYYTYGLSRYGNMPLVEPPETKEDKRIEDFVIAIDTSMSTSGDLVKEFLRCTCSILRSTETFTRKCNIRIIQCDNEIRDDTKISSLEDLKAYMDSVCVNGGSATDFRPVFAHVDKLLASGAFTSLRGLVYFTDGMGKYPEKRPPYETAFVLLEEPPISYRMPPWCIRLVLSVGAMENALHADDWFDPTEDLPEL